MGGFAALIGGVGQGAQQYGNQVRGFLENRRTGIANQLLQEAGRTWDPEHRSNLLQGVTDLMSNVPMDKALGPVLKSYQTHEQGTQWHAQVGQAIQNAMPQPGPPQPGPPAVGQQPGTTLPADITAALPPLSPVSPEAQGGGGGLASAPFTQGLAPNAPFAPPPQEAPPLTAAIGQPAAASPGGPTPQAMPQAFEQAFDPLEYTQRAYEYLRGLPPGAREGLAPDVLQGAEANRQLGIAYVQMGWRRQQAQPAIAEMDKTLNNPDSSPLERMAARSAKIQALEWIAGGGAAPAFPLTASTMLRAQEPVYHIEDATRMSLPDKQARGIPPEVEGPVIMGLPRMGGGPGQFYGQAPPHYEVGWTLDQNFNPLPMSFSPQLPNQPAQPIAGGPGGAPIQPTSQIASRIQTDISGRNFFTSPAIAQEAARRGLLTGGLPTGGYSAPFLPRYGETYQEIPQPDGSVLKVPMKTFRGIAGVGGAGTGAGAPLGAGVTAPPGPGGGGAAIPGPGGRSFTKVLPQQLNAAGQKTVSTIDAVLGQIDDAMSTMEKFGLDKTHDRGYWWDDYWNYKQSGESKYGGLWTNLSFTALRSAASALAGTNSRAYPIMLRALDHTPTLEPRISLNPAHPEIPKVLGDTPAGMYNKLKEMKVLLGDAKQKAFEDEKKSGVMPTAPAQGPGTTAAPPPTATGGTAPLSIKLSSGKTIEIH